MTTTLKSKLQEDLNAAIKAHDKLRSSTLRLTLSAITNQEVAGKEKRELSDDEVLKVITKEAKKRREAADAFAQGGRPEQAAQEKAEGEILAEYLPKQLGDELVGRSSPRRSRRRRPPAPRARARWAPS